MNRRAALLTGVALLPLALAACSGDGGGDTGDGRDTDTTLTVLAASSLTGVFEDLAEIFEEDNPGVEVAFAFDSSATLALQVTEGAPADVLATADLDTMQTVLDNGDAAESSVFATNQMVLVTPADNPGGVESFDDLGDDSVTYVICVDTAPCGKVAAGLLEDGGITTAPASFEVDVKAVLAKVVADEADAGLVYATDALAAGDDVRILEVPGAEDVPNSYPIAVVEQSEDADLARAWVDLVLSEAGRQILEEAGFSPAP